MKCKTYSRIYSDAYTLTTSLTYRRLGGKGRHVDFPLEKPTRRFFAG